MKKTILAVAVMAGLSFQAQANISDNDLADIDAILGEASTVKKEESKKTEVQDTKKIKEQKNLTKDTKNSKDIVDNKKEDKNNIVEQPIIQQEEVKPTIVVPVSGNNFVVEVKRYKDSILTRKLSSDEMAMSFALPVDPTYKDEKEIVDFVTNTDSGRIVALNNMEEEPNVLVDMNQTLDHESGEISVSPKLENLKYGYNFIVQFIEQDKKNNRIKLRIDYKNISVSSYNVQEVIIDNHIEKVKSPVLKTTNDSKVFWINFEYGSKEKIRIDETHYIEVVMGRVLPFVQPVIVVDRKKIEEIRIAAEEAKKAAELAEKEKEVKEEQDLYESLEKSLE